MNDFDWLVSDPHVRNDADNNACIILLKSNSTATSIEGDGRNGGAPNPSSRCRSFTDYTVLEPQIGAIFCAELLTW